MSSLPQRPGRPRLAQLSAVELAAEIAQTLAEHLRELAPLAGPAWSVVEVPDAPPPALADQVAELLRAARGEVPPPRQWGALLGLLLRSPLGPAAPLGADPERLDSDTRGRLAVLALALAGREALARDGEIHVSQLAALASRSVPYVRRELGEDLHNGFASSAAARAWLARQA